MTKIRSFFDNFEFFDENINEQKCSKGKPHQIIQMFLDYIFNIKGEENEEFSMKLIEKLDITNNQKFAYFNDKNTYAVETINRLNS